MSIKENVSRGDDSICRNSADLVNLRQRVLNIEEQLPAIRRNAGMPRFVEIIIAKNSSSVVDAFFVLKREKKIQLCWGAGVTMPG